MDPESGRGCDDRLDLARPLQLVDACTARSSFLSASMISAMAMPSGIHIAMELRAATRLVFT